MLQGINVSLNISRQSSRGFVIHPLLLILLDNLIASQGTKVLEDREERSSFFCVTDGAPQRQVVVPVIKYTGALSSPKWADIERGSVFISNNLQGTLRPSRKVRDAVQYTGRPLYCAVSDRARKRRQDVLHAESRYDITCWPHGAEGADRLDRLRNRKFSGSSVFLSLSDFRDTWV